MLLYATPVSVLSLERARDGYGGMVVAASPTSVVSATKPKEDGRDQLKCSRKEFFLLL